MSSLENSYWMKVSPSVSLAAALCLTFATSVARSQCKPGYVVLEQRQVGNHLYIYCGTPKAKARLDEIDAKTYALEQAIDHDKQAIEIWQGDLKHYMKSLDEWIAMSDEARRGTYARGLSLVTTLFLTDLEVKVKDKIELTRQELDELLLRLRQSPIDSTAFQQIVKQQGKQVPVLRRWEGIKDFLLTASALKDVIQALNSVKSAEYSRALIETLGLALHDPRAKIFIAELDFTVAAVYADLTSNVALRRVKELNELGDRRLRALASLSISLCKHVDAKNQLVRERAEILQKGEVKDR